MDESILIKSVDVRVSKISLRSDGIIQHDFKNEVIVDVDDIEEIVGVLKELTGGKKHPMLVITGDRNTNTAEARQLSVKKLKEDSYASAEAIVINSLPTRIAANFFFQIYKPKFPHKNFRSKKKAEAWLKKFL